MNELKEIKLNDVVYVRKDSIEETKGSGLFREIKFCGLNWQVYEEDAETVTLVAKKCLSPEIIKKVFKTSEYDSDYDVRFNTEQNIWWKDSIIRKRLNNEFLKMLDKDCLVPMTTTVWCDGESSTTKDYVRLLTVEEIFRLPKSIKQNKCKYGFWSLSPCNFGGSYAGVFGVNGSGNLSATYVGYTGGAVAPVIKLKNSALKKIEQ